uniref:Mortality factor 4 like 1 n=1 Tax=Oncorhynchus mykiss TaxID=8022 RepID=A0A8K9VBH9_ONCMY
MAPKQDPKPKFQEGERVLCFHGPLLYEAKAVKTNIKEKQIKYFIHYSGWNKNWDEWVPESRVLKYVDSNLQKQKELQKANQNADDDSKMGEHKKHYDVEGKMRGVAPSKKIAAVQQKNVDLKAKKTKLKTPAAGEGTSTGEMPQPPRKKRARCDPTVESVCPPMDAVCCPSPTAGLFSVLSLTYSRPVLCVVPHLQQACSLCCPSPTAGLFSVLSLTYSRPVLCVVPHLQQACSVLSLTYSRPVLCVVPHLQQACSLCCPSRTAGLFSVLSLTYSRPVLCVVPHLQQACSVLSLTYSRPVLCVVPHLQQACSLCCPSPTAGLFSVLSLTYSRPVLCVVPHLQQACSLCCPSPTAGLFSVLSLTYSRLVLCCPSPTADLFSVLSLTYSRPVLCVVPHIQQACSLCCPSHTAGLFSVLSLTYSRPVLCVVPHIQQACPLCCPSHTAGLFSVLSLTYCRPVLSYSETTAPVPYVLQQSANRRWELCFLTRPRAYYYYFFYWFSHLLL